MRLILVQTKSTVSTHLFENYDVLMSDLMEGRPGPVGCEEMRRCFFGCYQGVALEPAERLETYAEVKDVPALLTIMEAYLVDHNGETMICLPAKNSNNLVQLMLWYVLYE